MNIISYFLCFSFSWVPCIHRLRFHTLTNCHKSGAIETLWGGREMFSCLGLCMVAEEHHFRRSMLLLFLNLLLIYFETWMSLWWWWIVFVVWLTDERRFALFPAGTIVRDPHHCESPTRREQDLNLYRTWVQALLNEFVQQR